MAARVISAVLTGSSADKKNGGSASFGSSVSFGSPVSGMVCVGGDIVFSRFRGYASSFYFEIYIGGEKACETRTINDQNSSSTHELTAYIDYDEYVNSDLLLKGSGDIEVVVLDPGNSSNVCNFREGCQITINAYYEKESSGGGSSGGETEPEIEATDCTPPTTVFTEWSSTADEEINLIWSGAGDGENNPISGYRIYYKDSADNKNFDGAVTLKKRVSKSPQMVAMPAVGVYRRYGVRALGTIAGYYSTIKWSSSVLRLAPTTRCTSPTSVVVEHAKTSSPKNTLSWSGAENGKNNPILTYVIQYADSTDGITFGNFVNLAVVDAASANGTYEVPMPDENVYRKFKVWAQGGHGSQYNALTGTESNITFRGHVELEGFTDSPLVVGETYVKAIHMQELQDRANTLRTFYGLAEYNFTSVVSGETGLKDWTAHVTEVRAAVDEISTDHAAWLDIPVNCPRADVIEQLRAVILAM